jgi:hypothetical protein
MDNSNENKNLETIKNELFDPNDVSRWLSYSRQDFIGVMVHELKRETITIEKYADLMKQSAEIQSTEININGQHISATFCIEVILSASRMLNRLIDTTNAYNQQV